MANWWNRFKKWREAMKRDVAGEPYIDVTPQEEANTMQEENKPKRGGWLARWRAPKRQERQLATLQEGFNELVGLTRSIREHMEQQSATQRSLVELMDQLPGAVEGLKSVGDATKQQTETLQLLKQQLESAARNEEHMVESMRSFNKTLTLMDDMSKSTSQTVSQMADRTRDSEDMLRSILERSERRLIYMIVTLMVVTLTVLGVGLYIGLGQNGTREPAPLPPVIETPLEAVPDEVEPFEYKKSITELVDDEVEEVAEDEPEVVEDPIPEEPEPDVDEKAEEEALSTDMEDKSELETSLKDEAVDDADRPMLPEIVDELIEESDDVGDADEASDDPEAVPDDEEDLDDADPARYRDIDELI